MRDQLRVPGRRDLPAEWLNQRRQHLLRELALQPAAERHRRRLALALIPATVVLLAATAFTTYALTREPTHLESIGCFERADLRSNTAIVNADGRDPVAVCAGVWREGAFGRLPAPKRLEACVLETGAIGVFPRSQGDACSRLRLAALPATYPDQARRFAALRDEIVARLGEPASGSSRRGPQCVGEQAAHALVRRALDAHGYAAWRVETAGGRFTDERPCAEPSFDSSDKLVLLVPATRTAP